MAWNVWLNTPAFAEFPVVGANPLIVKKLAVTPVSVLSLSGTTVTVAVYEVLSAKVDGEPDHEIFALNWPY